MKSFSPPIATAAQCLFGLRGMIDPTMVSDKRNFHLNPLLKRKIRKIGDEKDSAGDLAIGDSRSRSKERGENSISEDSTPDSSYSDKRTAVMSFEEDSDSSESAAGSQPSFA